jgi:hypothetical protein
MPIAACYIMSGLIYLQAICILLGVARLCEAGLAVVMLACSVGFKQSSSDTRVPVACIVFCGEETTM